jgi:predicted amidohydrolase
MTVQSHVIRAAVVQAAPIAFDREWTLAKVYALTSDAASQGAQLVVFPDTGYLGYPFEIMRHR